MTTKINLNNLDWDYAPAGFDQTGTLFCTMLADLPGGEQAIIALDVDTHNAELTIGEAGGSWFSTASTQDWPKLDRRFGRDEWQEFLQEFKTEAVAELEASEN